LNDTIAYYDRNAKEFFLGTVTADMSTLYVPFLEHVPPGGKILDAGCGSGRDSLYFLRHGYQVEAFDASAEMCRLASHLIGRTVRQKTFDMVCSVSEFDGIWACAALLHQPRNLMDKVLERFCRALKPGGVLFVSFKLRDGQWEQGGRSFSGYDEKSFRELVEKHGSLAACTIWTSNDVRPERVGEQWLNAILQRVHDPSVRP